MTQELKRIIFQDKAASQALLQRSSHKATESVPTTDYRLPTADCAVGCSRVISQPPSRRSSINLSESKKEIVLDECNVL